MMIENGNDNEEDPSAPSLLELSRSPRKKVDTSNVPPGNEPAVNEPPGNELLGNDDDEYEIDDNIRSGVDTLLANELMRTENTDIYKELQKEIKKKFNVKFARGANAKAKTIEDILTFRRSRGLRLRKKTTIQELINFVKSIPSEK
jgi:hypothetical protein